MNTKKVFQYLLLAITAFLLFALRNCARSTQKTITSTEAKQVQGLNRSPSHINYSKHAKCRMECRHIDENEVKDMIANGTINYKKVIYKKMIATNDMQLKVTVKMRNI
jgi:rRNA-processing protein FCF1